MARNSRNRTRRRGRGRFGPLFKVLCLLALVVALTAGATVFFRVEVVSVEGNQRYTREEIVEVTGIQGGDNLYAWNKFQVADRLLQTLPYIGEVSIRRVLPSTVVITVSEWNAAARILPYAPEEAGEESGAADSSSADSASGDSSGDGGEEEQTLSAAQEPWLISVKGKLLESAAADSQVMAVTGLTALMPQAGEQLAVPQSQQLRLDALLSLLAALDEAGMAQDVSQVELGSTWLELRYVDRFTVKMELNADFRYELQVLKAVQEDQEKKHGPQASGSIDLTQEEFQAFYDPEG